MAIRDWLKSSLHAFDAIRRRREFRRAIRQKVRRLTRDDEATTQRRLKEIQRMEAVLDAQGRWLLGSRDLVPVAVFVALALLALAQVGTGFPFDVAVTGRFSEFGAEPVGDLDVPRLETVRELFVSGLSGARTEDGDWVPVSSIHLAAGDGGRIAVEAFPISSRGRIWWSLAPSEVSLAWKSPESATSVTPDEMRIDIALLGDVEGDFAASERTDLRRVSVRLDQAGSVRHRIAWSARASDAAVRFPSFEVTALDFTRQHPGVRETEIVSGWLRGSLDIPSRSERPFDLDYREILRMPIVTGRISGLVSTSEGWRLRFQGRAREVTLGSEGRNMSPSLLQHVAAQPAARTALAILTGLGALLAFLRSWLWR